MLENNSKNWFVRILKFWKPLKGPKSGKTIYGSCIETPAHVTLSVKQFMNKNRTLIQHLPPSRAIFTRSEMLNATFSSIQIKKRFKRDTLQISWNCNKKIDWGIKVITRKIISNTVSFNLWKIQRELYIEYGGKYTQNEKNIKLL